MRYPAHPACRGLLGTVLALAVVTAMYATPTAAQALREQFVYQVKATDCGAGQRGRRLTGFREAGKAGIVTALHGVVGCRTITASNVSDTRDLGQLRIVEVDVARDLALLSSPVLAGAAASGIPRGPAPVAGTALWVVGYPHGVPSVLSSRLTLRRPPQLRLSALLPLSAPLREFRERGSPSASIPVLSLEGHLTVGHSGAPILNSAGQLVGVANGGLASGATEITWAIPYPGPAAGWQGAAAAAPAVERLAGRNAELLFAFAADRPDYPDQTCFGRTFNFIRSASLGELVSTVDDPATYQALVQMTGLHGANLTYLLYRDLPQAGGSAHPVATLAIPEGWQLTPVGARCQASPLPADAAGLPITVEFDLRTLSGPDPGRQIEGVVMQKEMSSFFSDNFTIDPWASNPFPNLVLHRGLIARRKTYIAVDRRCGPGPFPPQAMVVPPQEMTQGLWESWPVVTMQNAPVCAPPRAIYPDVWIRWMLPRIPPGYIRGGGFGSYTASDEHVLLNTVKLADSALQSGILRCSERLSRSAECQRLYARQREWAAAVIAATVSTLTPSSIVP